MVLDEAYPVLKPINQDYSDTTVSNIEYMETREVMKQKIKKYQYSAGRLLWFSRFTRPSIRFAAHKLTRRSHNSRFVKCQSEEVSKSSEKIKLYLGGEVCINPREVFLEDFHLLIIRWMMN